jgi:hypothetical protein
MLPNRSSDGLNFDGVQMLGRFFRSEFDELLHVHVVCESTDENVNVAHYLQYI